MKLNKEQVKSLGLQVLGNGNKWQAEQHALLLALVLKATAKPMIDAATLELVINDFYAALCLEGVGMCNASQFMQFIGLKAKEKKEEKVQIDVNTILAKFNC